MGASLCLSTPTVQQQSPLSDPTGGDRCGVNPACRAILALDGGNGDGGVLSAAETTGSIPHTLLKLSSVILRTNDKVYNEHEEKKILQPSNQLGVCSCFFFS